MTFLRNAWYMAGWANELKDQLLARTLLGESILFFRKTDHTPVAVGNRCPHRFAPLSKGKKIGDAIQCGYHGLQFGSDGMCIHNPLGNGVIPKLARVKAYPLVQRHQMLWIWMGDESLADSSTIPNYDVIPEMRQGATNLDNYLRIEANYLLEVDNLLDLNHAIFLHDGSIGNKTMVNGQLKVIEEDRVVRSNHFYPNTMPFDGDPSARVDQWFNMKWMAPSNLLLEFGAVPPGASREGADVRFALHIVTPETEDSTHYFYGTAGEYPLHESAQPEAARAAQTRAFTEEDKPMVEACSATMNREDFWALKPLLLASDAGAVRARRVLERLIAEEAGQNQ